MPPSPQPRSLALLWAHTPVISAGACLAVFFYLLAARPAPLAVGRLLLEVAAVIGFIIGVMSFASVIGGAALLEEQSQAEPLRFQEAGWILGVPVGIIIALLLLVFGDHTAEGSTFTLYGRPLLISTAFAATLWAVLTRLLLRRLGLTRDDYACAVYMPRDQYEPLARRKQAWRAVRQPMKLTLDEAKARMPEIVPPLAEALRTARRDQESRHIMDILSGLGERSVAPALLEALASGRPPNRRSAAIALGDLALPDTLPELSRVATGDTESMVRRAAIVALGKLKDRMALPTLLQALQDKDNIARQSAAVALGKLGAPQALPALAALLKDSTPRVRQSAARAIERISGEEVEEGSEEK